jgi:hypothetical protein
MSQLTSLIEGRTTLGSYLFSLVIAVAQVRKKWKTVILFVLMGASVGLGWGLLHPEKFQARMLIAVEDDDSNGWQNLLSQFGIDVGGNNPGGIFKGESLVRLFKTRSRVEDMLLKEVAFLDGQTTTIANRLFAHSTLQKKSVFQGLDLPTNRTAYTPLQDSLLYELYEEVVSKVLYVDKPERKLSLIEVVCTHEDKFLAKAMTEELVTQTSMFYIDVLTKKTRANLNVLQREADSVQTVLNESMNASAYSSDLNVNPNRASLMITQNRALVDLQISVSLYGEIIKNLKLAEIGMRKQTPIIQIADEPIFPLPRSGNPWWVWTLLGALSGLIVGILGLSLIQLPEDVE